MTSIDTRLTRAFGRILPAIAHVTFGSYGHMSAGFGTIAPDDDYDWNGMQRGGDPQRPSWLFQYTLSGWGIFETARGARRLAAGEAMCAKIPSRHRYRNDAACGEWRFFWIIVNHTYAVGRLLGHPQLVNNTLSLPPHEACIEQAVSLIINAFRSRDVYETEAALFLWMLELERRVLASGNSADEKDRLMKFVSDAVMERLDHFVSVDELARAWGISRSSFSRFFHKATGISPATHIRAIRIREATRLLREQEWSVKEIAAKTGFSDANHLCKCFRMHLQLSPGTYRRLTGKKAR